VVDERQRDGKAPEDGIAEDDQRQDAAHPAAVHRRQIDALVAERALEHAAPFPRVIAARLRARVDVRIPLDARHVADDGDVAGRVTTYKEAAARSPVRAARPRNA